jgi:hypothetical protein
MLDNDSSNNNPGEQPLTEPVWVTSTLYLTPTPAVATVAIAIAVFAALMCFFFASAEQSPFGWALCGFFAAPAALIGAASVARRIHRQRLVATNLQRLTDSERLPTAAIIAGFVFTYSWMLMIGLSIFRNFFAANRPGGVKYNVTLGIALASSLYMALHGRSVIRKHFVALGGRKTHITAGQAILVVALALSFGAYFAWIMG